jgi:hypothetical protein
MTIWKDTRSRVLALLLALLAAGGITVAVVSTDDGHGHKSKTVTIHVDGVDKDTKADDTITLTPAAQGQLDKIEQTAANTPVQLPGADGAPVAPPAVGPGAELALPLNDGDVAAKPVLAGAAQSWPGCRTSFVRNQSYRTAGIALRGIFLHYTVSADTPGWADNDALTARANSPIAGVSWHFQIGSADGNCTYNVPISMKAWHAAGANSATVGIEIHDTGREAHYVEGAGRARLAKVVKEIERRAGIANQVGQGHCSGSTFVITRPGLFRHVDGGLCSGGHVDTNPFPDPRPMVISDVNALSKPPISAVDRRICGRVRAFRDRRHHRKTHHGTPKATKAGVRRFRDDLRTVRVRGHRCVNGKPVNA